MLISKAQDNKKYALFPSSDGDTERLFMRLGFLPMYISELVGKGKSPSLVVFTGGPDVTPLLYGHYMNKKSCCDIGRDRNDIRAFQSFINLPKVGICRGGQFLNVMSGGQMYQDVDGHNLGYHEMYDATSEKNVYVSSTHHQMMIPGTNALLLAYASESTYREVGNVKETTSKADFDAEVVYYTDTKSLCYQPHPEFSGKQNEQNQGLFCSMFENWVLPDVEKVKII